jgi:hypothetical protein
MLNSRSSTLTAANSLNTDHHVKRRSPNWVSILRDIPISNSVSVLLVSSCNTDLLSGGSSHCAISAATLRKHGGKLKARVWLGRISLIIASSRRSACDTPFALRRDDSLVVVVDTAHLWRVHAQGFLCNRFSKSIIENRLYCST